MLPIVFTNQPDVGRGIIAPATLDEMHARLCAAVPVEDIFVRTHDPDVGCECRNPKAGMLRDKWGIDFQRSFVIGDRWQDINAGRAVGCYTILIERPYGGRPAPDTVVSDLKSAVDVVLERVGG